MTLETWLGTGGAADQIRNYMYDMRGLQTHATNAASTYVMHYDGLGQVDHVEQPSGVTMDFDFDLAGNRTSVNNSLGGSETSVYDAVGNLLNRESSLRAYSQSRLPSWGASEGCCSSVKWQCASRNHRLALVGSIWTFDTTTWWNDAATWRRV